MSLLERTAEAIYLTATAYRDDPLPYDKLAKEIREDYERMAVTALTMAYREPILEDA